jgi:hypothetical protein
MGVAWSARVIGKPALNHLAAAREAAGRDALAARRVAARAAAE